MSRLPRAEALRLLSGARSGHLATVRPDGWPHLVVVTFAVTGDHVVTAIDHKPKTTSRLQRIINVEANGRASFLADQYTEHWDQLWWVRIDGPAATHHEGVIFRKALESLQERYGQYREHPPEGPVIAIAIEDVSGWASTR